MRAKEILATPKESSEVARIRLYAVKPNQQAFVHVVPTETGLTRTIWVSQSEKYPALLVATQQGRLVHPPTNVEIVLDGDASRFDEVNRWLRLNRHLLQPLAQQSIDIGDFYDEMLRIGESLTEMVNVPPRESRLPMVVYCSPSNAQHDVRVKVSPIHGTRYIEDQAISVAVRPTPHYPDDEQKRLSSRDFRIVAAWIQKNQQIILDYWDQKIDTGEFRRRIEANNDPFAAVRAAVEKRDWQTAVDTFKQLRGGSFRSFWQRYSTGNKDDEKAARSAFRS